MNKNELAREKRDSLENLQNQVTEAALEVQENLGRGFSSGDYCRALEYELNLRGIPYRSKIKVNLPYKGNIAGQYLLDFVIDQKMILSVLADDEISDSQHHRQKNFLKAMSLDIGMLINFGSDSIEIKALYKKTN